MKLDLQFDEFFNRPADVVWRAVTDPVLLARWLMENDFEPRVGHRFRLRDPATSYWRGWIECEVREDRKQLINLADPPRYQTRRRNFPERRRTSTHPRIA